MQRNGWIMVRSFLLRVTSRTAHRLWEEEKENVCTSRLVNWLVRRSACASCVKLTGSGALFTLNAEYDFLCCGDTRASCQWTFEPWCWCCVLDLLRLFQKYLQLLKGILNYVSQKTDSIAPASRRSEDNTVVVHSDETLSIRSRLTQITIGCLV